MKPTQPRHAGLLELLDRLLDKGVVLQADVLICLAGVPLIGIWLRAAVAAVETMLRYGMWEDWDAAVRAAARGRPVGPGPARFSGHIWRSGMEAWARGDIVLQGAHLEAAPGPPVPYDAVAGLRVAAVPGAQEAGQGAGQGTGQKAGQDSRRCLYLALKDGSGLALVVDDLEGLRGMIQERVGTSAREAAPPGAAADQGSRDPPGR